MNEKVVATSEKIQRYVSYILSLTVVGTFVAGLFEKQWLVAFSCVLVLISFYLPGILAKNFKVRLPIELELIIVLFLYGTLFLGEIQNFYGRFWWWDTLLHTTSGVIISFAGFLMLLTLYNQRRLGISALTMALFSFCFGVAIGTVWEIFEYTVDQFGFDMQEDGLNDTMLDLIVDSLGALFTATLGFIFVKFKKSPITLFDRLLQKFLSQNKFHRLLKRLKQGSNRLIK